MPLRTLKYSKKIQVLFIPVFVLMAVGLLIVYNSAARSLKDEHRERLLRTARLMDDGFDATEKEMMKMANLFQANRTLKEYLYLSTVLGGDREPLRDLLRPLVASLAIDDIDLYDSRGRRVLNLDSVPQDDPKEERITALTGSLPQDVMYGMTETSRMLKIVAVAPLRDRQSVVGYIAVGNYIDRNYLKELKDTSGNELFRVDVQGRLLSDQDGRTLPYQSGAGKLTVHGATYSVIERNLTGIDGAPLGKLVIALSDNDLNASIARLKLSMFVMLGLAALLSFIMSRLFIKTLVDPLKTMTVFTGKVARGELDEELPVQGRDEIAVLAGNFNDMQKQLKAQREVVEHYTGNLERSVEARTAELQKVQHQLLHSQKMEAIGQLSGGIAHDFNNILTAILGYADIVKRRLKTDDPLKPFVEQITSASRKAATLTRSLLAFSRKQVLTPVPIDLNVIVHNAEKLLKRLIREDIEFTSKPAGHPLIIMADSVQLEQVLMNLVTNAKDAMPDGGKLTIETSIAEIGDDFIKRYAYGTAGLYAVLTLSDTGMGMDQSTQEKIFEPFFTTKEVGKGTGLGLSMVYGIVKQHDGFINVYSEPGKGSSFRIYLPIALKDVHGQENAQESTPPRGGTETLLLAEDDPMIRDLIRMTLEEAGYTVIAAADGKEAVDKFLKEGDRVSLLILDVVMPKKSGRAVYEELRGVKPGIKVLFTSGYTADILDTRGMIEEGTTLIQKPLFSPDLLRKVRAALDG